MGILKWLIELFRPKRRVRDVSGLADSKVAFTTEVIDFSGGPLKPHHRRRELRDLRLLPKDKTKVDPYAWPRRKPKILPGDEAQRLFSDTMRTRNRNLRDLATDEEQLKRFRLPVWKSEDDVARALGLTKSQLQHFSIHRQRETTPHYVTFAIPKRKGGHRFIYAPKTRLKAIQRKLNHLLANRMPVSPHAHGFVPKRSVATNAQPHVGKAVVIKMDLKDCFPTIHFGRARGLLISLGYGYPVATTLAVLMTESPRQPVEAEGKVYHVPVGPRACVQGAPTSPWLCNAVLTRMDRRIAGLAEKHGFHYTRYADDLTLSGNDTEKIKMLLSIASRIVREEGFVVNVEKTRVLRQGQSQKVTGVTVNRVLGLSRRERRRLRAAIHQWDPEDTDRGRHLEGKVAYLWMLNPDQAAPLHAALRKKQK